MSDVELDSLPAATLPLTGTEQWPAIQGGIDVNITPDDVLAPAVLLEGNQTIEDTKVFASSPEVPTPTAAGHAVNKAFAESLLAGGGSAASGVLAPAKVVSTTNQNIGLSSGLPTIDGYQTVENDRVLLVGQTSAMDNGPWIVRGVLGWTRPADFAIGSSQAGMSVFVAGGTAYKGSSWTLNSTGTVIIGTTAQTWTQDATAVRTSGNQTIAGTKTFSAAPFVPDGSWSISDTAGLQAALDGKASDTAVVKLTGTQTVGGVKSFTSAPAVPDNSWTISDTNGLQAALDGKAADNAVMKLSGAQTAGGDKTLTGAVIVKNDTVFDVRGQSGWDPIAANNDGAFTAALGAALSAGGGTVLIPRLLKIAVLHDVGAGVDLQGLGSRQSGGASEVRCTAAGAAIRFADIATPQSGGISGRFRINGDGIATQPLRLGLVVGRTFQNIDIDDATDVGLLLQGAANCTFIEVNVQNCDLDACRVDRAAGNTFLRCEFGNAGRYQLNLMSGGSALPFLTDYPQNNTFYGCFFEYHESGTDVQVYQGAGINNMLSDCTISTDSTPSVPALRLVKIEKAGTPFSTDLKLRDCTLQFNFTHASTVAAEIGDNTRLILSGSTSIVNAGTGIQNATNGALEADRIVTSGVTTLKASTGGGLAYMRIRPDFSDSIACTSVGGVDRCLPVYVGGVFQGYVAVGQTPA